MRITIEKWSLICFLSVLFLVLAVNIPASHAQDSPQWHLPDGAIARLGKGIIQELAYSPDGSRLAVAGSVGVWLYDTVTYQEVALLTGRTHGVASVAYSPDGTTLASGSYQEVHLWDVATGNLINTLEGHESYVGSIAFSPDGNTIAAGSYNWVRLWDVATGSLTNTLEGGSYSVAFSPDGNTIAAGSYNSVRLWDVATGSLINTLEGGGNSVAFSPDGNTIAAAGGWRNRVRLWDIATESLINTLEGHTDRVLSVAFSPDGNTIAAGSQDNTVRLWDVATGNLTNTLKEHTGRVESITFSPDGITLTSGGSDGTVRLWDMATGSLINTLEGHTGGVSSVAFSPDGNTIAAGSGNRDEETADEEGLVWGWDNTVRLWDVATQSLINTFEHTSGVLSVAYSPDGNTIASGSQDNTVRLWDVATQSLINTLEGGGNSVAFSPDGNTIASGSRDGTVRLWDAVAGNLIKILTGHTAGVFGVAFSPDGGTLASGSWDRTVRLWDVATRSLINTLEGSGNSIAFSPDGNTISVGRYGRVDLWDAATGNLINTLRNFSGSVNSVMFSPDGSTLAVGSSDGTVLLWSVATGNRINTLAGHTDSVLGVAFSPDGTILASGGAHGTVLLWQHEPTSAPIAFNPPTIDDQTFSVDTPITPLTFPLATGGVAPYTYTLSPVPPGLHFDPFIQFLTGTPTTVGTTNATYIATDITGDSATLKFTIEVLEEGITEYPLDVNGDGQVNVLDLVLVAVFYGMRGDGLPADVNADGIVNVQDFAAVAAGVDAAGGLLQQAVEDLLQAAIEQAAELEAIAAAPMGSGNPPQHALSNGIVYRNVAAALADVRHLATSDVRLGKGGAVLEELLEVLREIGTIPETTMLLPNYPNPFNPETWIPYHLAKAMDVILTIYDARGSIVRELRLGHQPAGVYESRGRAAYWDGKNQIGEKVASGLYFYTLTAGEFNATRKLLIAK